ncbi:MAG: Fpg/Nei family DNA glycosylase [Propionibacteriaceae bacterium]|nr:MAG: Fpg/Nei family DNA glycosylase [Propionibacteriaceae bacterium]
MPEGDTVWLACQQLDKALAGRVLTRCELRVPQLATTDFTGVEVLEVASRGKHQLTRFANGWTLHTHLRMDGGWRVYPTGKKWTGGPAWQIRVLMVNAEAAAVGYRLPVTEMVRTDAEDTVVGHIGPDLLGDDWDADEALRRLRADPARTVGEALLDQRNLAGIGTLYRAEILFLQGVNPRTPVEAVPSLERVVARAKQLLEANKNTHDQITTGNRRLGAHWVFERPGQDCRRCGTRILTEEFGPVGVERRSYWCPHCQPLRTPDAT